MIPQNNPLANYLRYQAEIDEAVHRVLRSGRYILSEETSRFEDEFAAFTGTKYAVGTGSGTEAIHLALRALGIGPGDEVITVSHTAVATVAAIEMTGAKPVLIDIHPLSYTMNPELLQENLTTRTKAVIPVHLYGQPSDLDSILAFAEKHHLYVVEDCAQSHGAQYRERRTGAWGHAAAFSFYPTKNLGCVGDGGTVTTNDDALYRRLLELRQYGWNKDRISQFPGLNSRLDELQAAILRVKLERLEDNNRRRIDIARRYTDALASTRLILPDPTPDTVHVYHQYVVRCPKPLSREALAEFLSHLSIQTGIHYPVPVHLQPAYLNRLGCPGTLPVTEEICGSILSLPMFPELSNEDIDHILAGILEYTRQGNLTKRPSKTVPIEKGS
jgi:dTDP-4-amino-4,6-dideoxygalactose transaminase